MKKLLKTILSLFAKKPDRNDPKDKWRVKLGFKWRY